MKLFLGGIAFILLMGLSQIAQAQTAWLNTVTNGQFTNDANWSDLVPTAATEATIAPTTGLSLNITNADGAAQLLTVTGGGSVTLTNTAGESLTIVGIVPDELTADNNTISDGTTLTLNGGGTVTGNFNFTEGETEVGNADGNGTLDITSGIVNFPTNFTDGSRLIVGSSGTGTLVQSGTSQVNTGARLYIGGSDITVGETGGTGTGTYTLMDSAQLTSTFVKIGANSYAGDTSVGSLTISGSSSFTVAAGADSELLVGTIEYLNTTPTVPSLGVVGGNGTITQNGASTVNLNAVAIFASFNGTSLLNQSTGIYNLNGGTLTLNNGSGTGEGTLFGGATNATGTLNQSGGTLTLTATSQLVFGGSTSTTILPGVSGGGEGIYNLSGGVANINGQLDLGDTTNSSGIINQSGGTLNAGAASVVDVGIVGSGAYNLSGNTATSTATFLNGLNVGGVGIGSGSVTQTGGTLTTTTLQIGGATGNGTGVYNFSGGNLNYTTINVGATGTFNLLSGGTLDIGGSALTGTGLFNFSGGTALVTSSAWTDTLNGSVTGNSTINTTNFNATISGNLSGSGTLTLTGGGSLNLQGTNNVSGSWGVNIANGTLNATITNLSATGAITIGSGSTFNLNATVNPIDTFAGNISGNGQFNTGTNILVLTGNTNLSVNSATTIGNGGTLEVGSGTISNVNGTAGNAANTFIVGGVTGGTVNLLGTNLIPTVTVNAGSTLLANNITGNSVVNNGTLMGSFITGNLTNTGTLGSNLAFGTSPALTVGGTLASSGTIIIRTNGNSADLYQITGTANLTGGSGVLSGFGITPTNGLVVLSSAGITGFNAQNYKISGAGVLFTGSLTENIPGTELILNTQQNPAAPYAQTPNQLAVANAIDPALLSNALPANISIALNNLSAGQIPVALDQLSPEVLQYSRNIAFENSTFLVQQVDGALANVRAGYAGLDTSGFSIVSNGFDSGLGRSLSSLLAYNPPSFDQPAPNGVNYYPQENGYSPATSAPASSSSDFGSGPASNSGSISDTPNPETTVAPSSRAASEPNFNGPVLSEFVLGNVVLADMNQNQSAPNAAPAKASYTAGDATAGISFRMTNNLAAGILFDYNHTDAKTDGNGSKTDVDSYSPGIYATWFDKGFYVNGLFSFGYNTYSNNRAIPLLGATAQSSPTGQQYVTNLDGGYDFQPKHHPEWIFGPTLGLTYTHLDIDSFTETGASAADLSVASQSVDSLRSRLGGHVIYQARSGPILFQPNFTAMWQHEYLSNPGISSQFNIPGTSPFTIQTATTGKDSALLGAGVTMTLDNSMAFYVNYIADVGTDNFLAQSIVGGFKASF